MAAISSISLSKDGAFLCFAFNLDRKRYDHILKVSCQSQVLSG